jgi:DNA-binding MarR family transcriptional regulator
VRADNASSIVDLGGTASSLPHTDAFDLESSVAFLMGSAGNGVSQRFGAELKQLGFTLIEWLVCAALLHRPYQRLSEVARRMKSDASTLSRSVERLRRRGLLVNERRLDDRRSVSLALTPAGVELTEKGISLARHCDRILMHGIDERQPRSLQIVLQRLLENINRLELP